MKRLVARADFSKQVTGPLLHKRAGLVGGWTDVLRKSEAALAVALCEPYMSALGYNLRMRRRQQIAAAVVVVLIPLTWWAWRALHPTPSPDAAATAVATAPGRRVPLDKYSRADRERNAEIAGMVRDGRGQGIAGATVTLAPAAASELVGEGGIPDAVPVVTSDGSGHFRFTGLAAGEYSLGATAEGYQPGSVARISLVPSEKIEGAVIVLGSGRPAVVLNGTIADAGGGGIPGARVMAVPDAAPGVPLVCVARNNGAYRCALSRGRHLVLVSAEGYAVTSAVVLLEGDTQRDFRLTPGSSVQGVVQRRDGTPVPQATVVLERDGVPWADARQVETTASGEFDFKAVDSGTYLVTARRGGAVGRTPRPVHVNAAETPARLVVTLADGISLSGRVVDQHGAAVGAAQVTVTDVLSGSTAATVTSQPGGGQYQVEGLLAGQYLLAAVAAGKGTATRQLAVDRSVADVELRLAAATTVKGRVVDGEGAGVAGAVVEGEWTAGGTPAQTVLERSGADGAFQIADLPRGATITLEGFHPDRGRGQAGPVALAGEVQEIRIALGVGGFISGTVSREGGGPAAGARVTAVNPGGGLSPTVVVDAAGRYRVGPLEAGVVMVTATARGEMGEVTGASGGSRRMVKLAAHEQREGVDLLLRRGGRTIEGIVITADGNPAGGARVGAVPATSPMRARIIATGDGDSVIAGPDGRFELPDLTDEAYTVWALLEGNPVARRDGVPGGARGVQIVISSPGIISGAVVDGRGKPVANAVVTAVPPDDAVSAAEREDALSLQGAGSPTALSAAGSGQFELGNVKEGRYDVLARAAGGEIGRAPAVVVKPGGRVTGLRIQVAPSATLRGRVVAFGTGAPIPGARVVLFGAGKPTRAETDATGSFLLNGLPPEKVANLWVNAGDGAYVADRFEWLVPGGREVVEVGDLPLVRGASFSDSAAWPGISPTCRNGISLVEAVLPGWPAVAADVRPLDAILEIDARRVKGLGANGLGKFLVGAPGSKVTLTLERAGRQISVTITRAAAPS